MENGLTDGEANLIFFRNNSKLPKLIFDHKHTAVCCYNKETTCIVFPVCQSYCFPCTEPGLPGIS